MDYAPGTQQELDAEATQSEPLNQGSAMDVDADEPPLYASYQGGSSHIVKPIVVYADEAHPFELESFVQNYNGRTLVDRLIHIVATCPSLAFEAFNIAVTKIQELRDPNLYQTLVNAYEQLRSTEGVNTPPLTEAQPLDPRWLDETMAKNQADKLKLEVELKTYANNMIKESIRMGHRDLAEFHRQLGDFSTALKHYTKSREFCATSQHVLDMCLSVLELLVENRNYSHIPTYVFKADAALDAATSGPGAAAGAGGKKRDQNGIQTKLDFATALSYLGQANYEKAAAQFLKLGPPKDLGDWIGKLIAPGDIAIYAVLCAMATYTRSQLKAQILENDAFGVYLEHEPYVRDLISSYMACNFKAVLELLTKYSTRHFLDLHLASHVSDLTHMIQNWAVILYFQPFSSIKLHRMATAFGWTVEEVERNVVNLIQSGKIKGRVDSQNKILQATQTDSRAELFARALRAATEMQASNRKLLLRMRLQQADLVIKPPRQQHGIPEYMQGD
ncbi:hypothetical protein AX16_000658 [Volvariella volvacea WC 439]|nr:hypothetical protein AX16_000658 [Volvariella volvacea WC 439]